MISTIFGFNYNNKIYLIFLYIGFIFYIYGSFYSKTLFLVFFDIYKDRNPKIYYASMWLMIILSFYFLYFIIKILFCL